MACRIVTVKGYWRTKPRKFRKGPTPASVTPWAVVNTRTGRVVSRHRTSTAAGAQQRRLDRQSFRAGQGRPYEVRKRAA